MKEHERSSLKRQHLAATSELKIDIPINSFLTKAFVSPN